MNSLDSYLRGKERELSWESPEGIYLFRKELLRLGLIAAAGYYPGDLVLVVPHYDSGVSWKPESREEDWGTDEEPVKAVLLIYTFLHFDTELGAGFGEEARKITGTNICAHPEHWTLVEPTWEYP